MSFVLFVERNASTSNERRRHGWWTPELTAILFLETQTLYTFYRSRCRMFYLSKEMHRTEDVGPVGRLVQSWIKSTGSCSIRSSSNPGRHMSIAEKDRDSTRFHLPSVRILMQRRLGHVVASAVSDVSPRRLTSHGVSFWKKLGKIYIFIEKKTCYIKDSNISNTT